MKLFLSFILSTFWLLKATKASPAVNIKTYDLPSTNRSQIMSRQTTSSKLVFCHFMIGVVSDRTSSADFDADMQRAKSLGIDAFALNIGTDSYTDTQLGYAYESAANNDMSVFISFDFNWWNAASDAAAVGAKIAQYAGLSAQLHVDVDGASYVFASSFAGDGLDIATVRSIASADGFPDIYFAPNFHPGVGDLSVIDGALNWLAWENDGDNKAPQGGVVVTVTEGDQEYESALSLTQGYIAPASGWFSTHFGPEVSYSKNWVFPSDLLWYMRWLEILEMQPSFVEIVTWNDYGESHYIGPLSSPHTDDGSSKWVNDMPHNGWLDLAKPFISAYKAGASSPASYITSDEIIYWYRITPKNLDCDSTDTTMVTANNDTGNYFEGRPNGYDTMADDVFVVPLLTAAGTITVNTGATEYTFDAPAGASAFSVPFEVGAQSFALSRNGVQVMSATSLKVIQDTCPCGIYNFNAYVGTVPEGTRDVLSADGLASLTTGLKVACDPTPSLPVTPPTTTAATATSTATAAATSPPV
ncbi:glycosyl hydrolase family 71-domain-containing protein [Lentinula detonsa]|uniref:Glycosyl hydrolase family 71-domain-containing protein n=1 Tax=Lentinula detonsa TaxID=2804962 RepID=A0A9W8PCP6_9AGAR|nr:glycosyl hydrolase family 71-domain-containing protein [Lentinula detonsa]